MSDLIDEVRGWLAEASRVLVLTGAGISTDSGIPDFRGPQGVRAQQAAESCDLLLAVGSSLTVYPAAGLVPVAQAAGARVVIVNAEPTPYDVTADAVLRGSISDVLPELVRPLRP